MTSHKSLKSISHNFGHSFISLMNYIDNDYFLGHLLKQARRTTINRLTVDILKNISEPDELLTDQIRQSIKYWNNWFPSLVESSGSTMDYVSSAKVVIEFDLHQTLAHSSDSQILQIPFTCEIVIVDDRGKEYKSKHEGWWYPEDK